MANLEPPAIRVRLLGQISIWTTGGVVTTFRSNRVPALLGLLITQPGTHTRQALSRTLWPGATDDVGLHNLRQILVYLRASLGDISDVALNATRSTIALNQGIVSSDVDVLLSTERYQTAESRKEINELAAALFEGPFLPGINDEWIRDERSHLSQVYLRALLYLADAEMEGAPGKALEYAQRAVLEEPLMDGARARKLRALIRSGEKVAAQLEYEAFADLLDQELGITPSDTVRDALNDQVRVRKSAPPGDRENVSTDLSFALDMLGFGDNPSQAVDLALAATPHWISVGTPRLGMDRLQEALARAGSNVSDTARAAAWAALAELSLAKGDMREAERFLDELQRTQTGKSERILFRAMHSRTWINLMRLDSKAAVETAKTAIAIAQSCGDPNLELDALSQLSTAALNTSNFDEALESADRALGLAKRLGRTISVGSALQAKALALEELGAIAEAEECVRLAMQVVAGVQTSKAITLRVSIARLLENLGHLEEAESGYRQCLASMQSFENKIREVVTITYLGDLVQSTNRPREAIGLHSKALEIRRQMHDPVGVATSLRGLGRAYTDLNELHAAREALTESANLFLNDDAIPGYASVLLALAVVEEKSNHLQLAMRLARRALKLLRGMTHFERKKNGRSGLSAIPEAEELLARCGSSPV